MAKSAHLIAVTIFLATGFANAGEVLHFKRGDVQTGNQGPALWVKDQQKISAKSHDHFFVVQFDRIIQPSDRQNLETLGAKALRYIPEDALLIEAKSTIAATVQVSSPHVKLVTAYAPEWKISPELAPSRLTAGQTYRLSIKVLPSDLRAKTLRALKALDEINVLEATDSIVIAEGDGSAIHTISQIDGVEWIEPAPTITTMEFMDKADSQAANVGARNLRSANGGASGADVRAANGAAGSRADGGTGGDYTDLTGYESGTKIMGFDAAWGRGFTGVGQKAAMADTGLDRGDLKNMHADVLGRVTEGHIFGVYATSWEDPMGHGSHVAGSVVGNGATSGGKIKGGAGEAQFIAQGMWSPMMSNLTVPAKLGDLFSKAYDAGARIHTNSWGNPSSLGAYDNMSAMVDEFTFAHPDFLVLFAAGNSGEDKKHSGRIDPGSVSSPGTAKNALTVGASKNLVFKGGYQMKLGELKSAKDKWDTEPIASSRLSENQDGLAMFSSRGPTQDGRIKPDVVAPGTNILSVRSHHPEAEKLWGEYNNEYLWCGGTSMATPLTAGAATVLRGYLVDNRKIANPSAALIKAVLMHTAFDMYPGQFGEVGQAKGQELLTHRPNADEGYGRVDMDKATSLDSAILIDEAKGLATGEAASYPVTVSKDGKLSATMVYTDAPAAAGVSLALVNDLDLALVSSNGQTVTPNDHTNNAETAQMPVTPGKYEIRVSGKNVPQGVNGKQPFAVVITVE